MTLAIGNERRPRGRPPRERLTFVGSFVPRLLAELEASTRVRFPSPHYWRDPARYFREILGVEPWSKQIEVLEAVRDHPRVAVSSGHKVSKSHSAAGLALLFYCSFPDARAVMSSVTARQVDQILWRELRMMRARAGRCVRCKAADPDARSIPAPCPHSALIEGHAGELARTGLKSDDFREIVGFTAREAEAVAGISGRHLLYILDEASGIPDEIFEAVEGNRAGGARLVMFSNPTRTEGEFFRAFTSKKDLYHTIRISSEETPNVIEGRLVIPGLATREWIEEKRREWGTESALYKVRVKGEHALQEDGRIFSIHAIAEAEQRWHDAPEDGRLFVGVDPAGESGTGDEAVFAPRRGYKLLSLQSHLGLDPDAHLVQLLGLLTKLRKPRELPVVVLDREGAVGSKVFRVFREFLESNPASFELVAVRASDGAVREGDVYDRMRDLLAANLEAWLREGGAIVEDVKLSAELHMLEWKKQVRGRLKVTPKDLIRKVLGRSPDRYDALALAVWEPLALAAEIGSQGAAAKQAAEQDRMDVPVMDPYAGIEVWGRR